MGSTKTIFIFLTILTLTHPMPNEIERKWANNYNIDSSLIGNHDEILAVPKPQIGALLSVMAPTIVGFFSKLVKPMLSSLTDHVAKPSITPGERQHSMQLINNFLPAVFKNKPYSHTQDFAELRHKASGTFYKLMFDQLDDTKRHYKKFLENG